MRLLPAASLVLACILPFAAGCRSPAPQSAPPPTGYIHGSITLSGPLPKSNTAENSQVSDCPAFRHDAHLRDEDRMHPRTQPPVFLWISAGLRKPTSAAPRQQAVLTEILCQFQPQILGVLPNQPVDFANNDTFPAHFRVAPHDPGNPTLHLTLRPGKPGQIHAFPHPELMIPVTSPGHPSMHAYINVVSNPFFTLSGPQGRFTLRNLPPGTYSLSAIRPGFSTQTRSVTVKANAVTPIHFTFPATTPPPAPRRK